MCTQVLFFYLNLHCFFVCLLPIVKRLDRSVPIFWPKGPSYWLLWPVTIKMCHSTHLMDFSNFENSQKKQENPRNLKFVECTLKKGLLVSTTGKQTILEYRSGLRFIFSRETAITASLLYTSTPCLAVDREVDTIHYTGWGHSTPHQIWKGSVLSPLNSIFKNGFHRN